MTTSAPEFMQRGWERAQRAEEASRVEAAENEASFHFNRATAKAQAEYEATSRDLLGMKGPKWDKARDAAREKFKAETAEAKALLEHTIQEILNDGEMSEATDAAWDALIRANNHQSISVAA